MRLDEDDLLAWSDRVVARPVSPMTPPVLANGSVLRPAASAEALAAAERRLDVRLPESYRTFLSVSNGAFADWESPMLLDGGPRRGTDDPWVGLLPVEDLQPLEGALGWALDIWSSEEFDHGPEPAARRLNGDQVGSTHRLRDALLITSLTQEEGKFFLCLVPVDPPFDAGGEGWEIWDKHHDGFARWVSFFDWMMWRQRDGWLVGPPRGTDLAHIRALLDEDHPTRPPSWACGLLRVLAEAATGHDLVGYLHGRTGEHEDPYVRLAAAQALHAHDRDRGVAALAALVGSDEPSVRLAAEASLRVVGTGPGLDPGPGPGPG